MTEGLEIEITEEMIDAGLKIFERATWSECLGDYAGWCEATARDHVKEIVAGALAARPHRTQQGS